MILGKLIKIKEKARMNCERALAGLPVHVHVRSEVKVRDERIKSAMEQMKSDAPSSVPKFISEVTDPEFDVFTDILEQGMYQKLHHNNSIFSVF